MSTVNIRHMSLISLYTSFLEKAEIAYDIIYVDKYSVEEATNASRTYRYTIQIDRKWGRLRKLSKYMGFRQYAQKIMDENKYDYIVVWRTETALMFADYLVRKFRGRYCINVRDYCMERNPLVFTLVRRLVESADFTTISSDGFRSFLPKHSYVTVHSLNEELLSKCATKSSLRSPNEPIRVCYIGYVRFFDIDKRLIDALANDERYIIQYYGEGSQYLEDYCVRRRVMNVEFAKGFNVEETPYYLQKADVINNLYGYGSVALDTAISIRYYYALRLAMPILVFRGTHMERISVRAGIGYPVDYDLTNLADDFFRWYHSLNFDQLREKTLAELTRVESDNQLFYDMLRSVFGVGLR